MGIARSRLDPAVAQQLANHRKAFAKRQRTAGIGMAQVVNADTLQSGARANELPGMLKVGQMSAGFLPVMTQGVNRSGNLTS